MTHSQSHTWRLPPRVTKQDTRHIYGLYTHFHHPIPPNSKPSNVLRIPNAMDKISTIDPATLDFFSNNDFDLTSDSSSSFNTCPETYTQSHYLDSYFPSTLYPGSPEPRYTFASPETVDESSFEDSPPRHLHPKKSRKTYGRGTKRAQDEGEQRVKRHQTKLACSWCRKLSKKCDAQRPCGRCIKFDRCGECVDAPARRPRQLGWKPSYQRKLRESESVRMKSNSRERDESADGSFERKECDQEVPIERGECITAMPCPEHMLQTTGSDIDNQIDTGGLEYVMKGKRPAICPFTGPLEDIFDLDPLPLDQSSFSPYSSTTTSPEDQSPLSYESNDFPSFNRDDSPIFLTAKGAMEAVKMIGQNYRELETEEEQLSWIDEFLV